MRAYADMTLEEVMEAFADTVTRLAYLQMGNEQDTKDTFQNVFLKLYTQTMELHDPQHAKSLLRQRMYRDATSCMSWWSWYPVIATLCIYIIMRAIPYGKLVDL